MKNLFLLLSLFFITRLVAAPVGDLMGIVFDARTNQPLDFVTVSVTQRSGSKIVGSTATSSDGSFLIKALPLGQYTVRVAFLGYEPFELPFQLSPQKPNLNLGRITLSEQTQKLAEVQVMGQKSAMRLELDKKVFDVSQSAALAGSAATDVLRNIPSVEVDMEGNISLRNSTNVTIWLNGRPSGLTADNQAQILEQLPSESIDRIEVITNPSSKYSASGTAGIINIVLRKDRKLGYYGGVSGSADTFGGYNLSGNINVNDKKFDAYFNIGYRERRFVMSRDSHRTFGEATGQEELTTHTDANRFGGGLFGRAGFTYHLTEKDHIGLTAMVMSSDRNHDDNVSYSYLNATNQNRFRKGQNRGEMLMYNTMLDYQKQFDNSSDELRASVSFSSNSMPGINNYHTSSALDHAVISNQLQETRSSRMELQPQVDFTKKFSDYFLFETGYKGEFEKRQNNTNTYTFSTPEYSLWNNFSNIEINNSLYVSGAGKYKKFSYMAGLRGEWHYLDNYDTRFTNADNTNTDHYDNLYFGVFPTANLTYSFSEGNDLQINYSRRINRPRGRQLRPMPDISDSLNISIGNPNLEPDFANSFELNYLRAWDNHSLSSTLYLRSTDNGIFDVEYMKEGVKYTTYANIINSRNAGVEFVVKNRFLKIVDLTSTLNMYYNSVDAIHYEPSPGITSSYAASNEFQWMARIIAQIMLPHSWSIQAIGSYNSPMRMPQGRSEQNYSVDMGIRKSFLDRKLILSISGRDLLDSRRWRITTFGSGYQESSSAKFGGRMASITVSYNFGVNNQKGNKRRAMQPMDDGAVFGGDD